MKNKKEPKAEIVFGSFFVKKSPCIEQGEMDQLDASFNF